MNKTESTEENLEERYRILGYWRDRYHIMDTKEKKTFMLTAFGAHEILGVRVENLKGFKK